MSDHIFDGASKVRLYLLIYVLFGISQFSAGQKPDFAQDHQQWVQYVNIMRLPPNWILHSNASYRWREAYSKSFQYHVRSALGYQFTDNMRFLSGVAYFKPFNNSSTLQHEIRTFQEVFFNHNIGNSTVVNRFQAEERFLKQIEVDHSEPMYFRFRYGLFFNIPLFEFKKSEKNKSMLLTVRNELFMNSMNNPKDKLFDQDRISLGPALAVNNWRFFLLWHNQITTLTANNSYRYTSIFVIQVLQIVDFISSKEQLQGGQNYGD